MDYQRFTMCVPIFNLLNKRHLGSYLGDLLIFPPKNYVHNISVVHIDGEEGGIRPRHWGSAGASPGH